MLPANIQNLLLNKPKILTNSRSDSNQQFSLGLEEHFKVQPRRLLPKVPIEQTTLQISKVQDPIQLPGDIKVEYGSKLVKKYEFLKEEDINVLDYIDLIPDQQLPLHTLIKQDEEKEENESDKFNEEENELDIMQYQKEEQNTKQFLIDALSEELSRLDTRSKQMEEYLQKNQKVLDELKSQNKEIKINVQTMLKEKQLEQRIRILEEKLNIDHDLRLRVDDNLPMEYVNQQLDEFYEDNEELFQYYDKIMNQFVQETEEDSEQIRISDKIKDTKEMKLSTSILMKQSMNQQLPSNQSDEHSPLLQESSKLLKKSKLGTSNNSSLESPTKMKRFTFDMKQIKESEPEKKPPAIPTKNELIEQFKPQKNDKKLLFYVNPKIKQTSQEQKGQKLKSLQEIFKSTERKDQKKDQKKQLKQKKDKK